MLKKILLHFLIFIIGIIITCILGVFQKYIPRIILEFCFYFLFFSFFDIVFVTISEIIKKIKENRKKKL